jgi:hypothetical protein
VATNAALKLPVNRVAVVKIRGNARRRNRGRHRTLGTGGDTPESETSHGYKLSFRQVTNDELMAAARGRT